MAKWDAEKPEYHFVPTTKKTGISGSLHSLLLYAKIVVHWGSWGSGNTNSPCYNTTGHQHQGSTHGHPGVIQHFLSTKTLILIHLNHLHDELTGRVWDVVPVGAVELIASTENLVKQFFLIICGGDKWREPTEKNVCNDPCCPDVNLREVDINRISAVLTS